MTLLERIKELRDKRGGISINKLEKEVGLTRGSMAKWDIHAPSYDKLQKVADYFGVPVSSLLGEEQEKPAPSGDELTEEEIKFLTWYRTQASEKDKAVIKTIINS